MKTLILIAALMGTTSAHANEQLVISIQDKIIANENPNLKQGEDDIIYLRSPSIGVITTMFGNIGLDPSINLFTNANKEVFFRDLKTGQDFQIGRVGAAIEHYDVGRYTDYYLELNSDVSTESFYEVGRIRRMLTSGWGGFEIDAYRVKFGTYIFHSSQGEYRIKAEAHVGTKESTESVTRTMMDVRSSKWNRN